MSSPSDPHAGHDAATGAGAEPRRLLVVDDEPVIRTALVRFFTRRGWQVEEAADGEVARDHLLAGAHPVPYDAVISDLRMPRLSGPRLHDILQVERPGLLGRCIFSTGDAGAPDALEFARRTQCRVIAKPFELDSLLELVSSLPPRDA